MEFAVGEFLGPLKDIIPDIPGHRRGQVSAAIAQQNGAARPGHGDDGNHKPHAPDIGAVPTAHAVVNHFRHNGGNPQFHQGKAEDGNHIEQEHFFVVFQITDNQFHETFLPPETL